MLVALQSTSKTKQNSNKRISHGLIKPDAVDLRKLPMPAVIHTDGSARVQTVTADNNCCYYNLLRAFEARTGCPVLVNTSFNIRGEPIVCTPDDAYACFMGTNIDVLVIQSCVLLKEDQPSESQTHVEEYRTQFQPNKTRGMVTIDKNPSLKQLRQFGICTLVFSAILGSIALGKGMSVEASLIICGCGFGIGLFGVFVPRILVPLHLCISALSWPIRWIMYHLLLVVTFYLLVTPLGIFMRLRRRDPLKRNSWN